MRANPIRTPESMEIDRAPRASVGDRVSSDAAVAVAKSLVHTHLVVPSLTALNALLRGEWGRLGTLTEADEKEAMRAFKNTTLFGYELIWNNLTFDTQAFIPLETRHLEAKIHALGAYTSQHRRDYMQADFTRSIAHVRGVQIGVAYAECFEVIRLVF